MPGVGTVARTILGTEREALIWSEFHVRILGLQPFH
jgi:hypothetical protein